MSTYGATILEHFRRPRNYGDLESADIVREAYNPVCGDRVRISLRLDGDTIAAARFKGDACAICKAAASILTERIAGRTLEEAGAIEDAELLAALDAPIDAGRRQCAILPLQALRAGLAEHRPAAGGAGTAAVILAAGSARRFGANKLLARLYDVPLVRRTAQNTMASSVTDVVVVLGHEADRVRAALDGLRLRFVVNERHAAGMSGSLRTGVEALGGRAAAAIIVLADQPFVPPSVLDGLIVAHRRTRRPIVAPVYAGRRGNPVLFDRSVFAELQRIDGDRGARALVDGRPEAVVGVPFGFPQPPDVDTPAAYAAALKSMARRDGPG